MKKFILISCLFMPVCCFMYCNDAEVVNHKDLDENMIDMMMYHDNLGLYLREKNRDYAGWLLEGMDSSLKVVAGKFTTHRKLKKSFKSVYLKKLAPPIDDIRQSLKKNDFPAAVSAYRKLTKNCNNCHIDLDIDKEVIDWSDPSIH